jgi:hypothetical protein
MEKQNTLLRCPFCGCKPKLLKGNAIQSGTGSTTFDVHIKCEGKKCKLHPSITGFSRTSVAGFAIDKVVSDTIDTWNKRCLESFMTVQFFNMQHFPAQELNETFSKTVMIYNEEDNTFAQLGYYDFEESQWIIFGNMAMKMICWCYIPDCSVFVDSNELKSEKHKGYC